MMSDAQTPTPDELTEFSLRAFKGIEAGLGQADPGAEIYRKLEAQYPGHLVLIQAGKFLHGYDRSAYALSILKKYQLKLGGTSAQPHLRVGFPAGNFKRRLWPMLAEFGIPYVVALGTQASGHTIYISNQPGSNGEVLATISEQIVQDVICDLKQRGEVNKAAAQQMLANPDNNGFMLKARAQELDTQLLQDIIRMPRDLRTTFGENVRACMSRIMANVFAYGMKDSKSDLLNSLSADVDLLKHYLTQAPRLSNLKLNFEHRASLAVELGRLIGGLLRAARGAP
ncbi:MAG: hypothetical protein ABTQ26_01735 [Azonexus sp.]